MTPSGISGPDLDTYLETRLNLLTKSIDEQMTATDLRYQQRFDAQSAALTAAFSSQQTAMQTAFVVAEKAVQAALAAADRAVSKAELASDKRFESVNEFRQTLTDQQRTFMPRSEVVVMVQGLTDRMTALKEQLDNNLSESRGVKGGWGYAVGLIGIILAFAALVLTYLKP